MNAKVGSSASETQERRVKIMPRGVKHHQGADFRHHPNYTRQSSGALSLDYFCTLKVLGSVASSPSLVSIARLPPLLDPGGLHAPVPAVVVRAVDPHPPREGREQRLELALAVHVAVPLKHPPPPRFFLHLLASSPSRRRRLPRLAPLPSPADFAAALDGFFSPRDASSSSRPSRPTRPRPAPPPPPRNPPAPEAGTPGPGARSWTAPARPGSRTRAR